MTGLTAEVSATAFLTAYARAAATTDVTESFADPYAARFAELCPTPIRGITERTRGHRIVVARTLLLDGYLGAALDSGEIDAVINLGAGFDARPYRLRWPAHVRCVEVDCAATIELKERLLPASECHVELERLPVDLRDSDALVDLLAESGAGGRTAVLTEGVLAYLSPADVRSLSGGLAALGTGARWLCDVMTSASARLLRSAAIRASVDIELEGIDTLEPFEAGGWECVRYDVLPDALSGAEEVSRWTGSARLLSGTLELVRP